MKVAEVQADSRRRKLAWIAAIFLLGLLASFGHQLLIGMKSKGSDMAIQSAFRELARAWARSSSAPIATADIRSPIGFTTLGCRLWAFDFYRGNCFGMIIYVKSAPASLLLEDLSEILSKPCDETNLRMHKISVDEIRSEFDCATNRGTEFRLTVSFEKVDSRIWDSGHTSNAFDRLKVINIEGRL